MAGGKKSQGTRGATGGQRAGGKKEPIGSLGQVLRDAMAKQEDGKVESKSTPGPAVTPGRREAGRGSRPGRPEPAEQVVAQKWIAVDEPAGVRVRPGPSPTPTKVPRVVRSTGGAVESDPGRGAPPTASGRRTRLVLGLDFGTSCTKVVIQDPVRRHAVAVPFPELAPASNPYLLPSRLYVRSGGGASLAPGGTPFAGLKVGLIEEPDKVLLRGGAGEDAAATVRALAVAFLALVVTAAREWFRESRADQYRGDSLVWEVNLGLPARSSDDPKLLATFREVLLAACRLSDSRSAVTVSAALGALATAHGTAGGSQSGDQTRVGVIPEVIAEVIGYARSDLRTEGLHLLVDVGATTLDVSTFVLHRADGDDTYEVLTAEVKRLGAHVLHQRRIRETAALVERHLNTLVSESDGAARIPPLAEYLPRAESPDMVSIDEPLANAAGGLVYGVINETRKNRDPKARAWEIGLRTFVCGGGRAVDAYGSMVSGLDRSLRKFTLTAGLQVVDLPTPEKLDAPELAPGEYHRLGVAYGLSFPAVDLGKIRLPLAIADLEEPPESQGSYREDYVGMEQT